MPKYTPKTSTAGGSTAKEPSRSAGYGSDAAPVSPNMSDPTAKNPGQGLMKPASRVDLADSDNS